MVAAYCKDCRRRPKALPRQRCLTCQLRIAPIGEQVAESRRRLAMVPEELRAKRTKKMMALAPPATAWCAGCQSFRDDADFTKGAATCRACASARQHAASIEKTYGLTSGEYDALLKLQGGRCAICRATPKSKRLAVDHDHKSGVVLGLLCGRCNHELKGSAWDSLAMATALWHYMNTPPTSGAWLPPERAPQLTAAVRSSAASGTPGDLTDADTEKASESPQRGPAASGSGNATTPRAYAHAILAGLSPDVPTAHALYAVLRDYLAKVDPPPF